MKKTIIPIFLLLASCTSDPSTIGLETRSDRQGEPTVTFNLESDSLTDDTAVIVIGAKEWEEQNLNTEL